MFLDKGYTHFPSKILFLEQIFIMAVVVLLKLFINFKLEKKNMHDASFR